MFDFMIGEVSTTATTAAIAAAGGPDSQQSFTV